MKYTKYIVVGLFLGGCCVIPHTPRTATTSCPQEQPFEGHGANSIALWPHHLDLSMVEEHETEFDIPVVVNQRVEQWIDYYRDEAKLSFSTYLRRSRKYIEPMRDILASHGIPKDLVFLALIESGFNPFAYSPARAMGPWQFLAGTARIYGLRRDAWVDERRDPIKSTEAAARYLKDLYEIFGDWYLVLAAYNTGQYRVQKAMREAQSRDFWALDLSSQTEDFVPRFLAAVIMGKDPESYGFSTHAHESFGHEVVYVDGETDLRTAAACLGYDVEVLRQLNPELRRFITPPHDNKYPLRIPKGAKDRFFVCQDEMVHNSQAADQPQG